MTTQSQQKPSKATRARNKRICRYIALVEPIARFYASNSPEPIDDLRQVGLMGLLRASELYEPKRKIAFEAFAKPHIRGAMLHYLRDGAPAIRLPRTIVELRQRDPSRLTAKEQQRLDEVAGMRKTISLDSHPGINLEALGSDEDGPLREGEIDTLGLLSQLEPKLASVVSQVVLAGWSYRRTAEKLGISPMTVQRRLKCGLALLKKGLTTGSLKTGSNWSPAPFAVSGC
ncbi:sigma-70 family RNA polymerase sigma factor [Cyanobium sp. WAJ14-Wanaka]|uniref:sigma-70 family RNA polymerase sigma factor n=1 Tax=Cyanobium sp. WAJ14-Wanaka TaxID=2823725 RepID=UPI0020CE81FE|nr:sigma-70 family RNA polymerase sigma factor [Cyanobium sp. WAJ14-Wanaka]MCP9774546.1 sigma-70 family RNA polymerase sigma factor [Cyanobium sp. WAJ14-Wanaka]